MNNLNENVAHLSWCALVALHINNTQSPSKNAAQEDLFLLRWLIQAQRQKRFSREVADSLNDMITFSRQLSRTIRIKRHLLTFWNEHSRLNSEKFCRSECQADI